MKSILKKNKTVSILPENVKGAALGTITKSLKDSVEISVPQNDVSFYKPGSKVELFAPVEDGILYLSADLESIVDNSLKIKLPQNHEILQRREFTRIPLEKKVTLKEENLNCTCLDISAGGMKLESPKQLDLEKDYTINFSLENGVNIKCYLRPIRLSSEKKGKYIVSGRFVLLKNIDKIAIVQFCFKKQIEDTNK